MNTIYVYQKPSCNLDEVVPADAAYFSIDMHSRMGMVKLPFRAYISIEVPVSSYPFNAIGVPSMKNKIESEVAGTNLKPLNF